MVVLGGIAELGWSMSCTATSTSPSGVQLVEEFQRAAFPARCGSQTVRRSRRTEPASRVTGV
jgi:hypothetical protein